MSAWFNRLCDWLNVRLADEAMRDWVTNLETTHYLVGSAIGPHPFPTIVRDFQNVIGNEIKEQMKERIGKLPDAVIACVGGGSNAIGTFHPFINDKSVRIIGVEAGGEGIDTDKHSATLSKGTVGVLHGVKTYLLQTASGQITETHSICAGLDYPGVGPEHAWLKDSGRAEYVAATDIEALKGFKLCSQLEGIIPGKYHIQLRSSQQLMIRACSPRILACDICRRRDGKDHVEGYRHLLDALRARRQGCSGMSRYSATTRAS